MQVRFLPGGQREAVSVGRDARAIARRDLKNAADQPAIPAPCRRGGVPCQRSSSSASASRGPRTRIWAPTPASAWPGPTRSSAGRAAPFRAGVRRFKSCRVDEARAVPEAVGRAGDVGRGIVKH